MPPDKRRRSGLPLARQPAVISDSFPLMRLVWTSRTLPAPDFEAWRLLTDVRLWPLWGPSVREARIEGGGYLLEPSCRGTVLTAVGVRLPFEVTEFEPGRHWAWSVAGVPATAHSVDRLSDEACEVAFGVPWAAAPYLLICRMALSHLGAIVRAGAPRA